MNTLEAAIRYVEHHGFSVIPIRPGDKRSAIPWEPYQVRRPTLEELERWFTNGPANIGIVCGAISGLVVLDIDGPEGERSLADVNLPHTCEIRTPHGRHLYFRHPGGAVPSTVGLLDHVDVRGDGSYVVAPPSTLPDGAYRTVGEGLDRPTGLAIAPELVAQRKRREVAAAPSGEAYRRITGLLRAQGSERRGKLWQCPAHHDPNPSLSIDEAADGKVLLKCFGGCAAQEVMAALNRPMADLFSEAPAVPRTGQVSAGPAVSLEECVDVYQRWLHLPDADPLRAALGTVAGNLLHGDALWVLFVGSSGSGKTALIESLSSVPYIHQVATITEAALLSGSAKRDKEPGATGGVLRQIGQFGILLAKDFGSVLSMHRDARSQVMAALREVADGSWARPLGTTGGRVLTWSGKCGLVGAVTPTIDRHYGVMSTLGERFLLYRIQVADPRAQARQRLRNRGREDAMRGELAAVVAGVLRTARTGPPPSLTEQATERLVDLSTFMVWGRTPVERDGYNQEVLVMPSREAPARLAGSLSTLLDGLQALGATEEVCWRIVEKVAWDCLPDLRRRLLFALREASPAMTADLVASTGIPKTTADRVLEDLSLLGLALRDKKGGHDTAPWVNALSEEALGAWPGASPEKSVEGTEGVLLA